MTYPAELPHTLQGMLDYLEVNGWDCRLRAQTIEDGSRRYAAKVWRSDLLGGSRDQHDADPALALARALLDARKKRRTRAGNLRQRHKHAEAIRAQREGAGQ